MPWAPFSPFQAPEIDIQSPPRRHEAYIGHGRRGRSFRLRGLFEIDLWKGAGDRRGARKGEKPTSEASGRGVWKLRRAYEQQEHHP